MYYFTSSWETFFAPPRTQKCLKISFLGGMVTVCITCYVIFVIERNWLENNCSQNELPRNPCFNSIIRSTSGIFVQKRLSGMKISKAVGWHIAVIENNLNNRGIYVMINGINIFLCLLWFFKAADFQPKLVIVTRTVGKSFQELAHFFALLSAVWLMCLIFGQVVFGDKVQQFSNLTQSAQTVIN